MTIGCCAGGLGLAALQLSNATKAIAVGTTGSRSKRRHVRASGMHVAVSSRATELVTDLAAVDMQAEALLNSLTSPGARPLVSHLSGGRANLKLSVHVCTVVQGKPSLGRLETLYNS